jgi:sugar phosphate isomerase/epimerase
VTTGLSLANLSVADAGPLELIDAAAAAGFTGVNMWLIPPRSAGSLPFDAGLRTPVIGDAKLIREIKLRVASSGVRVFMASCNWLDPTYNEADIPRVLDTFAEIGARRLSIVGWEPDRSRAADRFATICARCAEYGITATLEFMPYSCVRSLDEAMELLNAVRAPNLELLIDALHLARSGGTPADLRAIDPTLLAVVQICDAPKQSPGQSALAAESRTNRLHPGDGELPLRELLAALPADGAIEIEVPCKADSRLGVDERVRRIYDRATAFLSC